jgi:hypothetical protein
MSIADPFPESDFRTAGELFWKNEGSRTDTTPLASPLPVFICPKGYLVATDFTM